MKNPSKPRKRKLTKTALLTGDIGSSDLDELLNYKQIQSASRAKASSLLTKANADWYLGEWESLTKIVIEENTEFIVELALLKAAGLLQQGNISEAKIYYQLALDNGVNSKDVANVLISGMHVALARIAAIQSKNDEFEAQINASLSLHTSKLANSLAKKSRMIKELASVGRLERLKSFAVEEVKYFEQAKHLNKLQVAEFELIKKEIASLSSKSGSHIKANSSNKRKLILVATMPRSGSTWLFNCIREIIMSEGKSLYSCWFEDYVDSDSAEFHVVKVHAPEPSLAETADMIFSTRRDIRQVAASLVRMNWDQSGGKFFSQLARIINTIHSYWYQRTNLEIEYTNIVAKPSSVVEQVGHGLGVHLTPSAAQLIATKLSNMKPTIEFDKDSQLHPNHRDEKNRHYSEILDEETILKIEAVFNNWLIDFGYENK